MSKVQTPPTDITDQLKTLSTSGEKKFIFQNQKCMLTYKTHLNKDEYKKWMSEKIHGTPKFIELAHEHGLNDPKTPYEHTHVLIDFGRRFQTQNTRFFDYNKIHPNINVVTTTTHWKNSIKYIAKEDEENKHLLETTVTKEEIISKVQDCKTTQDVLSSFMNISDNGKINWQDLESINRLRQQLPSEDEEFYSMKPSELNYPWQLKLIDQLSKPCDIKNRKIIWYVDPTGNTGKSELAFSLSDRFPDKYVTMQGIGRQSDNAMNLKNYINQGWKGHCLFINLARNCEQFEGFYESLEEAKDARITCRKYEGGNVKWRRGYVVVFANWYPKKDKLSNDRWDIRWISKDKDSKEDESPPSE